MKNNIARLATLAEHQASMLFAGLAPLCLIWVAAFATIVLPHWFASHERGLFIAALRVGQGGFDLDSLFSSRRR